MSKERRVHPNPFRTRKLSASSPMILRIFAWESRSTPRYIPQPRQESCRGCCVLGRTENAKKTQQEAPLPSRFRSLSASKTGSGKEGEEAKSPIRVRSRLAGGQHERRRSSERRLLVKRPPQLGWGFKKAFSFTYIVKTPFDLLALSCGLATAVNNKSKGGHYG